MSRPSIDPASFEDASDSDVSTYNPDPRNPGVDPKVYLTNPVQPPPANPETKEAIEARRRRANDADHYHTVANPAKGEKPGERGLPNQGYRPGRKTARRLDNKRKRKGGDSEARP